jgi:hypothetical protein
MHRLLTFRFSNGLKSRRGRIALRRESVKIITVLRRGRVDGSIANVTRSAVLGHGASTARWINCWLEDIQAYPAAEDAANKTRFTAHKGIKAPALLIFPRSFPDLERLTASLL